MASSLTTKLHHPTGSTRAKSYDEDDECVEMEGALWKFCYVIFLNVPLCIIAIRIEKEMLSLL